MTEHPALTVTDLRVTGHLGSPVLCGVSYSVSPGELLALVGESGSGKTTAALAALGHFRRGLRPTGGTVALAVDGRDPVDLLQLGPSALRELRGSTVAYVPQDPALSLNPNLRIGRQIAEVLDAHRYGGSAAERAERVREVLTEVGLPGDPTYRRRYPHQLSGGQQQRVGIAMAIAARPSVVVLDEPTTGLDVTTQAVVLRTVGALTAEHGIAALYITHDLAVVSGIADRVAVMHRGHIVESGPREQVLRRPGQAYTRRLIASVPDLAGPDPHAPAQDVTAQDVTARDVTAQDAPAQDVTAQDVTARDVTARDAPAPKLTAPELTARDRAEQHTTAGDTALLRAAALSVSFGAHRVLTGINLAVDAGESVMLLGQSGSGKTTLSRCVSGLTSEFTGMVSMDGVPLARSARQRDAAQLRDIQYVFQSPYSSLNPRRTIAQSVEVPLCTLTSMDASQRRERVRQMLDRVRLPQTVEHRYPDQLSGGERQRVAIARALVTTPRLLVCDEVTSALDVSVQATILELLAELRAELGMSLLFVTHNIALARHVADRIAVLSAGVIVETGPVEDILEHPGHVYTRELLENTPRM